MEKRKPVVALLLSMLAPGLGQVYNTELGKGIILQILIQLAGVGIYIITSYVWKSPQMVVLFILIPLLIAICIHLYSMIDAYRIAKQKEAVALKPYNKWYIYVLILIISWGLGACYKNISSWRSYKMVASSMEPTLQKGDRVFVNKYAYSSKIQPKRGDVIAFIFPEDTSKDFIKRVVAIPGDKVEIRDRIVIVDGKPVVGDYVIFSGNNDNVMRRINNKPEIIIPENKYYVLGDNRDKSYDSRFWGFVDRNAIIGKAMFIYYSSDSNRIILEIH